ncbi:14610_t:CDS:2, partial [Racocetra fulgida]
MFCVLMLCYSVFENQKEKRFGKWFPIGLTLWGLLITTIMVLSGSDHQDKMMQLIEFYVFQGVLPYIELPESGNLNEKSLLYENENGEKGSNYGTINNSGHDVKKDAEFEKH